MKKMDVIKESLITKWGVFVKEYLPEYGYGLGAPEEWWPSDLE